MRTNGWCVFDLKTNGDVSFAINKISKQRANDAVENNAVERKAEAWLLHL